MGMSLELAEWVSWAANWTLLLALLCGLSATYAIVVSGNIKETALKRDLASATQAAAEANLKAETERLERLKLEAKLAPRSIEANDLVALGTKLKSAKDAEIDIVSYEYAGGDVVFLTLEIEDVFKIAQAKTLVFSPFPGSGWAKGIVVCLVENSPPEREALANDIISGFLTIGIAAGRGPSFKEADPIAGAYSAPNGAVPRQKIRVLVGSKP